MKPIHPHTASQSVAYRTPYYLSIFSWHEAYAIFTGYWKFLKVQYELHQKSISTFPCFNLSMCSEENPTTIFNEDRI